MSIKSIINQINKAIAVKITVIVGTMWCVYAFSLLVAIPLIFPDTQSTVMFISSSFLQLVLLPILMVGQQVLSESADQQRAEDHMRIKHALHDIHALIADDKAENLALAELRMILQNQQTLLEEIQRNARPWR
jgi:hypothetical protein